MASVPHSAAALAAQRLTADRRAADNRGTMSAVPSATGFDELERLARAGSAGAALARPPVEVLPVAQPRPAGAIAKVRYTHDAMIDLIVSDPWISQNSLAAHFGYTAGWVSQIIASDAFQARLAQRKEDLIDPALRLTIEENFKGLVRQSMMVLQRKLEANPSDELVLKTVEIGVKALGYGAKSAQVNVQNNFVVEVPGKARTSADWEKAYGRTLEHGEGDTPHRLPVNDQVRPIDSAALLAELEAPPARPGGLPDADAMLAELTGAPNGNSR